MVGSAHIGEGRFLALAEEFGWPVANAAIEAVLEGAERRTQAVISNWQDGVYRGEATLDDDGRGNSDIHIRATVTKNGSDLVIDLSDSHPQVTSFINSSYPNMYSSVVVALSYLIDPDTPKNDGTFRPITVVAKPGTVVWANPGAPVTLATNHCGQQIIEAIIKALAPACPERVMAGWGRRFRIAIQGTDPRSGKPFIWHLFQARPGGGEWQAAGGIKFGSLEVTERRFPLFFRQHEFRPDSGGDGQYHGGAGGMVEMVVETAEAATLPTTVYVMAPAASSAADECAPRTQGRTGRFADNREPPRYHRDARGAEGRPLQFADASTGATPPPAACASGCANDGAPKVDWRRRLIEYAIEILKREKIEAVAVCYLHAYRDAGHERATGEAIERKLPGIYISLSSEVLPQIKEYERVSTTVVYAYVGPVVSQYLARLERRLAEAGYHGPTLTIQSHGGVATIEESARLAAGAVPSGPAGGVAGSVHAAGLFEERNLIPFDMGGTSTDISLIVDGQPSVTNTRRKIRWMQVLAFRRWLAGDRENRFRPR